MAISLTEYKNKVFGCWMGKNIGGTLGAPFECVRGVFDIDFYVQDMKDGALPNDDLDLQLVWLNAAEKYGKNVDSLILAEYWLSYVVANWSEYGAGKNNLARGLLPPLSGWYNNHNRQSCGAFIRSELWACLAPGHPEIAVKYAYEDAIVDHSDEGVYAEVFCAAIQSAAFSTSDTMTLIDIGLSYIPGDCAVRIAIMTAVNSFQSGQDWKAARKSVLTATPGTFGMYNGYQDRPPEPDVPVGEPGFDAPSNIGIMVIGWLYGRGDFGRSLCIAAGCGEDGDCTAATLGALLGIISGYGNLPEKWLKPIGDGIKTIAIDMTTGLPIPKTVTELSHRVCALMPVFMREHCDTMRDDGPAISLLEGDALYCAEKRFGTFGREGFGDKLKTQPFGVSMSNALFDVTLTCADGVNLKAGQPMTFGIAVKNNMRRHQWLTFKWLMPCGWDAPCGAEFALNLDQPGGGFGTADASVTIIPGEATGPVCNIALEVRSLGRPSVMYIPITLINSPQTLR